MKKPVREMLPKGSRTEEELLQEQAEFLKRKTDGKVQPAATLATRKPAPLAAPVAPAAGAGKPISKFALERQRQRDARADAAAAPGAAGSDGAGGSGDIRGRGGEGATAGAQGGEVRQRMPPPKLDGEPMSVVDMQIVEKSTADHCPLAPTRRTTPAPVARHRSEKISTPDGAGKRGWGREGGGKSASSGEVDLVGAADEDEEWVGREEAGGEQRRASHVSRGLTSKEDIHEQNQEMLGKMSKEQIAAMKKDLESQIDGALLQKIRGRALQQQRAGGGRGAAGEKKTVNRSAGTAHVCHVLFL